MGVLRQDHFLFENERILGVALQGNPELWDAMVEKERLLEKAAEHFDADRFSELEEIVQLHDGYSAEARAATILEGLASLDTTVVIVAYRRSSIVLADEVIFTEDGRITGRGTHDRLYATSEPYRSLIDAYDTDGPA